jgi:rod shape determining protein RodA
MATIASTHALDRRSIVGKLFSAPWIAFFIAVLIGAAGVVALYSASGGNMEPLAMRHLTRLVTGLAIVLVMAVLPMRFWMALAYPVYALLLFTLALVPYLGTEAFGAQRWLAIGTVSFQPAEPMKIALILVLARFYQSIAAGSVSHWIHVAAAVLLIAAPCALVLNQPDLGTAILIASIGLAIVFTVGTSLWYFVSGAVAAALGAPVVWSLLHDYQKSRIAIFLEPESDPLGKGYQIMQSKIALGSGGMTGKGLLQGTQGQLDFIPEAHTDFIFALIAEEMGFMGGIALIGLFGLLILAMLGMALRCRNVYGRIVCIGAATTLFLHVIVNIAMVIGALPVVGVPLPLVSYGGTSLFSTLAGLGLAMNAAIHRRERLRPGELGTFWH